MIDLRPYSDAQANAVLRRLDAMDHAEASVFRGAQTDTLALFAEWRAAAQASVVSLVFVTSPNHGSTPFAVLNVAHTGAAGVAQAAFLSRNHAAWRGPIARAGVMIRARAPEMCRELGIHRVEARCWSKHRTAQTFLTAIGFQKECAMRGFGRDGQACFEQFSLTIKEDEV